MQDAEVKERIRALVASDGGRLKPFAEKIGIEPAYLSSLLTGQQGVSASIYRGISRRGYSIDWLLTGEGHRRQGESLHSVRDTELEILRDWLADKESMIQLLKHEVENLRNVRVESVG